jgi:2-oxoglutarate ferredoxin oxidoreductase subunit alpha
MSPTVSNPPTSASKQPNQRVEELQSATIRMCGDSGDGMQLAGTQFTNTSAIFGNDIATFPDFPAEIRAPAGTLAGVSGFQVHFSSGSIHTPGDKLNALIAMNPAALRTNLKDLESGGILIVNADSFGSGDLHKAGLKVNPLEDGSLKGYRLFKVPITMLNRNAVSDIKLSTREADRCKNFFALGLVYWLYERPLEPTIKWIRDKFHKNPAVMEANTRTLKAGYNYGDTCEAMPVHYRVPRAPIKPGKYRKITGNEAIAMGLVAAANVANIPLMYASYPITPASDILHSLSEMKRYGVRTIQAEDEIAAMGAALGASFGGALGVTATSGPGICLKSEAIGLAVMTELPCVIIDVQRGGPSTGLPTKTEQADLLQAMFGRNGEAPVPIVAPCSPADCFAIVLEAVRIALTYRTPVMILSDGAIANGSEPWLVPDVQDLPDLSVTFATTPNAPDGSGEFWPYLRDPETLARPWAVPGTPGLQHRIGGLEKADGKGSISYDPDNHDKMVRLRAAKIAGVSVPDLVVADPDGDASVLAIGWGSTFGPIGAAARRVRAKGKSIATAHLRHLNPLPANLGDVLSRYERVVIPEMNLGQLAMILRATYLVDAISYTKVAGLPFKAEELQGVFTDIIEGGGAR